MLSSIFKHRISICFFFIFISGICLWASNFHPAFSFLTATFLTAFVYEIIIFIMVNTSNKYETIENKKDEQIKQLTWKSTQDTDIINRQEEEIIRLLKVTGELK